MSRASALSVRVLTGPTACGKSAVAQVLAGAMQAEILSIDSMKLYRGLDIGTAKPSPAARAAIKYHLIDVREPWEGFSVAEFLAGAEQVIAEHAERGAALIGEGGTALYLKALTEGLFHGPGRDLELRARLEAQAQADGVPALHARLARIDPAAAARILTGDLRRIIRALEVHELTGVPISTQQAQWGVPRAGWDVRLACLRLPRAALYDRIDRRAAEMIRGGWLDECRALRALPRPLSREALQALGYRTLFKHLDGEISLEDAQARICFDTHHFARRQLGWFKRLPGIRFIDVAENDPPETIAARVLEAWD